MENGACRRAGITAICLLIGACASEGVSRDAVIGLAAEQKTLAKQQAVSRQHLPKGNKSLLASVGADNAACRDGVFTLNELSVDQLRFSHRDVQSAAQLLTVMGYASTSLSAVDGEQSAVQPKQYTCDMLPLLLIPSMPGDEQLIIQSTGLSDMTSSHEGTDGSGQLTIEPLRKVNAVDLDQVLVFYHPSQMALVERLHAIVESVIDSPSPQVYIETMVLEVSQEDSEELGVSYLSNNLGGADGNAVISLGALEIGDGATIDFSRDTTTDEFGDFNFVPGGGISTKVKALVENGEAEVLSRPSILALSNRQAVIQIVDVIQSPIVESSIGASGELVVSAYQFEPLLLGITLNLRPRVSANRQWVSLEIDATVESEIDENSGAVFAPDGNGGRIVLAEKQGSTSRKVKTFARIPDRTPIVIGGLVAENNEQQKNRLPGLGKLPVVGALFGATDNEVQKREIVIVLTPHVLDEELIGIRSNRASQSVMDRQTGLKLFPNHHQLAANDVFDMNFVLGDPHYRAYQQKARAIASSRPHLANDDAVDLFINSRVPGDAALVDKMVFDIVSKDIRRSTPDLNNLYLSNKADNGVSGTITLEELFAQIDFEKSDKAIVISVDEVSTGKHLNYSIVASELAGSSSTGRIVLRTLQDKQRLLDSIVTDLVVQKNGGSQELNLQTFQIGKNLLLIGPEEAAGYLLSARTLSIFEASFDPEQVLQRHLQAAFTRIDELALVN